MPLTGILPNLWTLFAMQNHMSALFIEKKCSILLEVCFGPESEIEQSLHPKNLRQSRKFWLNQSGNRLALVRILVTRLLYCQKPLKYLLTWRKRWNPVIKSNQLTP